MARRLALAGYQQLTLLPVTPIAAAATAVVTAPVTELLGAQSLSVQFSFLYGAGGTTVKAWVQTSFDRGLTWIDIMAFAATTAALTRLFSIRAGTVVAANITPTDGTLTDNSILDGVLGNQVRVKYTTTGTYTGATSLAIHAVTKGA